MLSFLRVASGSSSIRKMVLRCSLALVVLGGPFLFFSNGGRSRLGGPHLCVRSDLRTQYQFVVDSRWTGANSFQETVGKNVRVTTVLSRQILDSNGVPRWVPLPNHRVTIGTAASAPNPDLFERLVTDEGGRAHFNFRRKLAGTEQLISKIVYCHQTYDQCLRGKEGSPQHCFLGPTDEVIDESGKSPELGVVANVNWKDETK